MKKLLLILSVFLLFAQVEGQSVIRAQSNARAVVSAGGDYQNLLLYSEELENDAAWIADAATSVNSANDVAGNATLETLTGTGDYGWQQRQVVTLSTDTEYEISFEVIRGTATSMRCSVYANQAPDNEILQWDFYAETSASVQRISNTFTTNESGTGYIVRFNFFDQTGTLFMGRMQIRETAHPEGYVKTEGTIVE